LVNSVPGLVSLWPCHHQKTPPAMMSKIKIMKGIMNFLFTRVKLIF